mmetsp:Transcript_4643/g.11244  ORF Transcript_4643/g.11244 Transcript_4643/m.11244 type:complete len:690 (+) Transcript_4643:204-2273(+)
MAAAFAPWRTEAKGCKENFLDTGYPSSSASAFAWNKQEQASAVAPNAWRPDHNVYMINLDGYSDDSDEDMEPAAFLAMLASKKKAAQIAAAVAVSAEGEVASKSIPPWRRPSSATSQSEEEQAKPKPSEVAGWRRGAADSKGDLSCSTMDSSASNLSSSATDSSSVGSDTEQDVSPNGEQVAICSLEQAEEQEETIQVPETASSEGKPALRKDPPQEKDTPKQHVEELKDVVEAPVRSPSWMSQRSRGLDENAFERRIKSLLNKLTLEKFDQICKQIVLSGFSTLSHVELFIQEVFQKATGQHHFIDMYADLCVEMQRHLAIEPLAEDPKGTQFKRLLLNQCQHAFEVNLHSPATFSQLEGEDRLEAEVRYKMAMLGNIRLVGALLTRKMLAGKVLIAITEELLADSSSEALESLATLLTVVGRTFDTPEWTYHIALRSVLDKVRTLASSSKVERRVQCLLKDVVDLRSNSWQDMKPKRMEGPRKLSSSSGIQTSTPGGSSLARDGKRTPLVGGSRLASFFGSPAKKAEMTAKKVAETKIKKEDDTKVETKPFDLAALRIEVKQTLEELAVSHDVQDATARLAATKCPAQHQAEEIGQLLEEAVQGCTAEARQRMLALVVGLVVEGHWTAKALSSALAAFLADVAPDLHVDMPNLPQILSKEVYASFAPLAAKNLLLASEHDAIIHAIC